jgi:hypothetical protein
VEHTVIVNKLVLKAEKERDKFHKELEYIEMQLHWDKRELTHDDTGDDHDMDTEDDEWDLRDFNRETTRVQNRRNMTLGSLHDQPKPRIGKDGFLLHTHLGIVGWISYWCNGDSVVVVDVVVALINMLDLTELVSVSLTGTQHKETTTNTKIHSPRDFWQVLRRGNRPRR